MIAIARDDFILGSIKRKKFKEYNKRYFFKYRDVVADLVNGNKYVIDYLFSEMREQKVISDSIYKKYELNLLQLLSELPKVCEKTEEEWYNDILELREDYITPEVVQFMQKKKKKRISHFKVIDGINQSSLIAEYGDNTRNVYIFISECKYIEYMFEVYKNIAAKFNKVYLVVNSIDSVDTLTNLKDLNSYTDYDMINKDCVIEAKSKGLGFNLKESFVENENDLVIGFGEWCLGAFKNLNVDSFVYCESREIITRGLTNSINKEELHCVFVPKGFDLISKIKVVERSIFNYRVYSWIYKDYGKGVYELSFDEVLNRYQEYFINCGSDQLITMPIELGNIQGTEAFLKHRMNFISQRIRSNVEGVKLGSIIIKDRNDDPMKVTYTTVESFEKHHFKVASFSTAQEIRQFYRDGNIKNGITSNFLFFTTDKSIATYNNLRQNRPLEQYKNAGWHIDYKLEQEKECFPLYNKATIAMTSKGEITFFRKRLKAGKLMINDILIKWNEEDVDSIIDSNIKIYTPYGEKCDTDEYLDFTREVGHKRINIIIINNQVVTVRKGAVLLPSIGVVVSLTEDEWNKRFSNTQFDDQGYGICDKWKCRLELEDAYQYQWAYGGGMFLIYDSQKFDSPETLKKEFAYEGWLTNMSKQTQDSETFRLDKHPRTAIGKTRAGQFFIIVCSGRSKHSVGADYLDLINIAESLFDDVEYLMNVDGGASSFIGIVEDHEVFELNDITFTNDSCAGTLRSLNSILSIEFDNE